MPKIDRSLLNEATIGLVGGISYTHKAHREEQQKLRKTAGITKGQWKRFQISIKRRKPFTFVQYIKTSEVAAKKLEVMRDFHDSPHLMTLLKAIEAREGSDD